MKLLSNLKATFCFWWCPNFAYLLINCVHCVAFRIKTSTFKWHQRCPTHPFLSQLYWIFFKAKRNTGHVKTSVINRQKKVMLMKRLYLFVFFRLASPFARCVRTFKPPQFTLWVHLRRPTWVCWGGTAGSWAAPPAACWLYCWPVCSSSAPSPGLWCGVAPGTRGTRCFQPLFFDRLLFTSCSQKRLHKDKNVNSPNRCIP